MGNALAVDMSPAEMKDAVLQEVRDLKARHARVFGRSVKLRREASGIRCRTCKAPLLASRERLIDEAIKVRGQMHEAARRASARGATRAELQAVLGCSQSTLSLILRNENTSTTGGQS